MRVHHLSVQAFGPFATRQEIDFDGLSAAGLFLLNGETGAGKTSILDAICYALYAGLPGEREGSKSLRSDHAEPGLAPEVMCEFSTGSRRFEVTRSPAWARPAKRGSGTTTAQAQSRLRELVDGAWVEKSTRNDEVAAELLAAIGLGKDEFTKVAMLPQGAFAAFLRAKDKEREALLKSLFDTSTYGAVEALLADELNAAKAAAADAEAGHDAARSALLADARASLAEDGGEAVIATGPAEGHPVPDDAELGALLTARLAERTALLREAEHAATAAADAAAGHAAELERRAADHRRLAELDALRATHERGAAGAIELETALALHAAAAAVAPVLEDRDRALADAAEAAAAQATALDRVKAHEWAAGYLAGAGEPRGTAQQATAATRIATEEAAVLEASLPDEAALAAGERELATAATESAGLVETVASLEAEITELETGIPIMRERLEGQRALGARAAELKTVVDAAEVRVAAVAACATAEKQRIKSETAFLAAKEDRLVEESTVLQIGRTRLGQAAAALARTLRDGCACPVCGAVQHPAPADTGDGDLLGEEDEEAARAVLKKAAAVQEKAEKALQSARDKESVARGKAGGLDARTADRQLETARSEHRECALSLKESKRAKAELELAEARLKTISAEASTRATELGVLRARIEHLRTEGARLGAKLSGLRAGAGTLKVRHLQVREAAERLDALAAARSGAATAERAAGSAARRWAAARAGASFADDGAHASALLPAAEAAAQAQLLESRRAEAITLRVWEAAPEVARARADAAAGIGAPEPGLLDAARGAVESANATRDAAVRAAAVLGDYARRLHAARRDLEALAMARGPLLKRLATAKSMAELARGGGENRLKMSLSTYVLAARLEAVALAATERLAVMTSQRYALVHDDGPKGNSRSGLGLHVLDAWTGQRRDTQTLSGGESFMASLALALGLADVIAHQSGGIDIETLFVDEGFGSLDEETLEQVMDALENLRSGGRVVGLVSHVADMKQRITTQLRVHKGRNGSTVSLHLGG
ncbi:AAA family ATPase [Paeniglutamicibacter cryotolerans]|uniref:Nuclease SbcCD subunit C n=1 Tax=Paeniglutamicibacter cryotolerans TaxID=670079 RepID=A0A839QP57_9MICC|nr:SMC family ATPase [Paeniglutamicibacter cryotolerans]MBB2996425.1 exonuclease SbcC [Paeniglutamicibacter cryotolerans]